MQRDTLTPLNNIAFTGNAKRWGKSLEQQAKEWTKKREAKKPPRKLGRYKLLLLHFYVLYLLFFVLSISIFYVLV
mgnify:FL=1